MHEQAVFANVSTRESELEHKCPGRNRGGKLEVEICLGKGNWSTADGPEAAASEEENKRSTPRRGI